MKTKADLEKALGPPTNVDKVGPVEKWTYKASDGQVTYIIVADQVTLANPEWDGVPAQQAQALDPAR